VPAGAAGAEPPGGIGGERFAALMERLPKIYDVVLISGPPADTGEATELAGLADGVLLVSDDDEGAAARIAAAQRLLGDAPLLGGVLVGSGAPQSGRQGRGDRASSVKR
jgi:hypothetical protein